MYRYPIVAVIPTGPREQLSTIVENIDAIRHYGRGQMTTVLIDDTGGQLPLDDIANATDVFVLKAGHGYSGENLAGRMFVELCRAYEWVGENFEFEFILRLDHDALVIGPPPLDELRRRFAQDPTLGILGRYEINTYGEDCDWIRDPTITAIFVKPKIPLRRIRQRLAHHRFSPVLRLAESKGYRVGEFVGGGVNYIGSKCAQAMIGLATPYLDVARRLAIPEDYIFTLVARAAGFRIGDFSGPDDPLAYRVSVLPFSPDECLSRGKHAVHSTRRFEDLDEQAIRAVFRQARVG